MRVAELWRFPVESMQGEQLESAEVGPNGLAGDRHWALHDAGTGLTLTARREPLLLMASARLRDGGVEVALPDGSLANGNGALSAWLGRPVELHEAGDEQPVYENPLDFERERSEERRVGKER